MSLIDQDLDLIRLAIKENQIAERMLRKCMKNIEEIKVVVNHPTPATCEHCNDKVMDKLHDNIAEMYDQTRSFCDNVQYEVQNITVLKNKLQFFTTMTAASHREFWKAVTEDKAQANPKRSKQNKNKVRHSAYNVSENSGEVIDTGCHDYHEWETTIMNELETLEKAGVLKPLEKKITDEKEKLTKWSPWIEDGLNKIANPLPGGITVRDVRDKFENNLDLTHWHLKMQDQVEINKNQKMSNT